MPRGLPAPHWDEAVGVEGGAEGQGKLVDGKKGFCFSLKVPSCFSTDDKCISASEFILTFWNCVYTEGGGTLSNGLSDKCSVFFHLFTAGLNLRFIFLQKDFCPTSWGKRFGSMVCPTLSN